MRRRVCDDTDRRRLGGSHRPRGRCRGGGRRGRRGIVCRRRPRQGDGAGRRGHGRPRGDRCRRWRTGPNVGDRSHRGRRRSGGRRCAGRPGLAIQCAPMVLCHGAVGVGQSVAQPDRRCQIGQGRRETPLFFLRDAAIEQRLGEVRRRQSAGVDCCRERGHRRVGPALLEGFRARGEGFRRRGPLFGCGRRRRRLGERRRGCQRRRQSQCSQSNPRMSGHAHSRLSWPRPPIGEAPSQRMNRNA